MLVPLADVSASFENEVVDRGELPALLLLVAFGATFGITRFITHSIRSERFSWLGNVEAGDTHIHHLVWGIVLLLISGLLAVAVQPPLEVTAIVFGIGAALTLDEFALWLHLDDVYWSEQGRQSIDAVIVFAIVSGFMVLGAYPVSFEDSGTGIEAVIGIVVSLAVGWTFVIVCFMKGKLIWGVLGLYLPPIAIVTAFRLARPNSWWARNKYADRPEKLERSRNRYKGEDKVVKPDGHHGLTATRWTSSSPSSQRCCSRSARCSSRRRGWTSPMRPRDRARACCCGWRASRSGSRGSPPTRSASSARPSR